VQVRRKVSIVAMTAAATVGVVVAPALAATTPLPTDLTGPSVTWQGFDNWLAPDESVAGCTSLDHEIATGDYLSGYGPQEAFTPGTTDGFDTYALVTVEGTYFLNPDNDVDVANNTVTSDTRTMSGLDVTIQHTALQTQPILRTLVKLTNNTDAALSRTVTFEQDLGSDADTWIQQTSSGDAAWTAADRWAITSQTNDAPFEDPVIGTVLYGPGAIASPMVSLDLCGERWDATSLQAKAAAKPRAQTAATPQAAGTGGAGTQAVASVAAQTSSAHFYVTVPAGETRYLAFFNSATTDESVAPAEALTPLYDAGLTGALAEGLDPAIIPNVVNWSPAPEVPVVIAPTFTG